MGRRSEKGQSVLRSSSMNTSARIFSHIEKCEKAFETLEDLRFLLELDSTDEVETAVTKILEDYAICAEMLDDARTKLARYERIAA